MNQARFSLSPLESAPEVRVTMAGRVYQSLRRAIISLDLKPGDPLSEAEVARQIGTSRQPVREAFIKLFETGFVDIVPQRGTFVRRISSRAVGNVRFVRQHVEMAVACRACETRSPSHVAQLRRILIQQQATKRSRDYDGFLELDDVFHQTVAAAADCETAWKVVDDLKGQMDRVRYLSVPDATSIETLVVQHRAVVDAIEARDVERAGEAMRNHLSEMLFSLPLLAARHPEFFSD